MEFSLVTFSVLIVVGFLAGLISAIAGSGGLIVLPTLLSVGMPPLQALATNKFQSVFGTLSSTVNFFRKGHIDLKTMKVTLLCAFVGALVGTWAVQQLDTELLKQGLPYFLLLLALYVWFSPRMSNHDTEPRCSERKFDLGVGGGIGFYGGFLGPGMGSFFAVAYSSLRGYNLKRATAHTKPLVLITNTTSMVIFVLAGKVFWSLAIPMALAQVLGARIGSNLVINRGANLIKPVLVTVIVILALKLIFFP